MMKERSGIGVSEGVVVAKAIVLDRDHVAVKRYPITEDDVPREIARFEDALTTTRHELLEIRKKLSREMAREQSDIFNAHLLVLEDRTLIEEVIARLRQEKFNVEYIFSDIILRYSQAFLQIDDNYLRERMADIKDIGKRVTRNLMGVRETSSIGDIKERAILVSHDLSPSQTALINPKFVVGFVTEAGGAYSHSAIIARAFEIPAVVGVGPVMSEVSDGDLLVVDGKNGKIVFDPDEKVLASFKLKEDDFHKKQHQYDALKELPATTKDGFTIQLAANIEFPFEVDSVHDHGAESVGLFRTEYMYMNRADLPSEDEQFVAYKKVAEGMKGKPVVVRTLDVGGDKIAAAVKTSEKNSSVMGSRAIRYCLEETELFKTQLRAILRASAFGDIKILYPMITNVIEIRRANELLNEAKASLKEQGYAFNDAIQIGAMIEVPSSAVISDLISREVDFLSIGSNDLIQYALAVDRENDSVADLYQPTHPAVIRLIQQVIEQAHENNIWVSMCGEMAGDPVLAALLLGMGVDTLSASPALVPKVKAMIRLIKLSDAKKLVQESLKLGTSQEINAYLQAELKEFLKEVE